MDATLCSRQIRMTMLALPQPGVEIVAGGDRLTGSISIRWGACRTT
jgi:hypothetical protein